MNRGNAVPRNSSDLGGKFGAHGLGRQPSGYFIAALVGAAVALGGEWFTQRGPPPVHRLEQPLMIGVVPGQTTALLPVGTSMYFDRAFPEGFVRYKVYINVEGVRLESHEPHEKFWLSPLSAGPIEDDHFRQLLQDYPLSRDDLAAILSHSPVSREQIRDLLREYE